MYYEFREETWGFVKEKLESLVLSPLLPTCNNSNKERIKKAKAKKKKDDE